MLPYFDETTLKLLSDIIGPCLDRKVLARFFYGNYDLIRQQEIKLHIIWCKNCQVVFNQYLEDLEGKVSTCPPPEYYEDLFKDKGINEKIVSIMHTLQCERCMERYASARGDDMYLDRYEERLVAYSDPVSRLRHLRYLIVRRRRGPETSSEG
ncbi:MAG: hypothetical protein HYV63_05885 [Candidatus Schekmanbacteria bacterium]|nr:hypothetical protein [Candidatus Schekmanbacteria bacterium]